MSDTKEELKPCPFCGAPAARAIHDEQWVAGCSNEQCRNDALIPFSQWNTRPPIPALKVAREALGPFAKCADIASRPATISPQDLWVWKPSSNRRDLPGISVAHLDAAKAALALLAKEGV
jgi:hypothetical protein